MESRLGKLLNWVVLVGGIAAILWPAFIDERLSLTQILISLFEIHFTINFATRWLSVILVVGAIYILVTSKLYRNIPLSVIWTKLHIHFEKPDGSRVRFEREQALRANQPKVTAIFMSSKPSTPEGRIIRSSITGSVYCGDNGFPDVIKTHGTEKSGFEIIQMFGRPLPYSWYLPLFPMWYLNREPHNLPRFLRTKIAVRNLKIQYENEFNGAEPSMTFTAANYPHINLEILLHLGHHQLKNLHVERIKNNGIVELSFRTSSDGVLGLHLDRLQNETLRITWDGSASHQPTPETIPA